MKEALPYTCSVLPKSSPLPMNAWIWGTRRIVYLFQGPWLSSDLWHQKYRDVRNMQPIVLWLTEMACWEPKKRQLWWNDNSCYVFGKWTKEKFPWNNRTDKNVIAQPKMNQPVLSFRKHSRKPKNSVSNQLREDRCWMSVWDRRKCPH